MGKGSKRAILAANLLVQPLLRIRRAIRRYPQHLVVYFLFGCMLAAVVFFSWLLHLLFDEHSLDHSVEGDTPQKQVIDARLFWQDVIDGTYRVNGSSAPSKPGLWEKVMDDVAIVVKTGSETHEKRLRVLKEKGWMSVGRRIPNLLVIGDSPAPGVVGMMRYGTEVLLDAEWHEEHNDAQDTKAGVKQSYVDVHPLTGRGGGNSANIHDRPQWWFSKVGWRGDKDKNLPAFHLLRTLYPNKKWYIMLDDDTYIFLDNFAEWALRHDHNFPASQPTYTGKIFYIANCGKWDKSGANREVRNGSRAGFAHGGSGIVLNGAAIDIMYPHIAACVREFSSCWAGDMQVGLCLRKHGVQPARYKNGTSFERHFTPFSPSHALGDSRYTGRWSSMQMPLTYHKVDENEVALLSEFERLVKSQAHSTHYRPLAEFLLSRNLLPTFSTDLRHVTHELHKGHPDFQGLDPEEG